MDLLLSTANNKKEFYIDLLESKFYFPGDVIKGDVVLNLDKPTKTNHIRLTFTGTVQADGNSYSLLNKTWFLATCADNDGKAHVLEAQTHRLPFEFHIPTDAPLPSSVKISSMMGIRYTLHAVHDRPFVPERLSSQAKKEIRLLEHIDVTQPEYCARGHVYEDIQVLGLAESSDKVRLALTLPTYGVVRGDLLPLTITIKHHQELARREGIKINLIRRVFSGKNRHKLSERKSIKSFDLDIDIHGDDDQYEQCIHTKLLIPTNTPPTVSDQPLTVDYSIRVVINLNNPSLTEPYHENYIKLESSVVIGTWPKASLSIDDDDDDDTGSGLDEDTDGLGEEENLVLRPSTTDTANSDDSLVENIQHLGIRDRHLNKPLPPPGDDDHSSAHVFDATLHHSSFSASSSSLLVVDPTIPTGHQQQQLLSSSPKLPLSSSPGTATIIDPLSGSNSYLHRHESTSSNITIDPTAPMKPNRKDSVSSIPSPSSISPPASTPSTISATTIPSPPRPLVSRPPPLPQPSSSSSTTTTSSSFAMPDISAYLPAKSSPSQHHQSPSLPITNYLPHPSNHHRTASSSSNTSSHSTSSPLFTQHQPISSSSSSPFMPTVSMPTPYPPPPPPPPINNSTYPEPGGLAMPMPMNMSDYNQPPPPPQYHYPYQTSPLPPPPPPQQHQHCYYPPPPYPPASSWS